MPPSHDWFAGVRGITGSLADLCPSFRAHGGAAEEGDAPPAAPMRGCADLIGKMRAAIGAVFLSAEGRFGTTYRQLYGGQGATFNAGFRCAGCYHLFGVDMIADSNLGVRVIEVNIAPDLTLSTEGRGCERAPPASGDQASSFPTWSNPLASSATQLRDRSRYSCASRVPAHAAGTRRPLVERAW